MTRSLWLACWCVLICPCAGRGQSDTSWQDRNRAIAAALAASDTATYWSQLNALQRQVGTTPRLAGRLAAAAIARHQFDDGIHWMRILAAMGTRFDSALAAEAGASGIKAALWRIHAAASRPIGRSVLSARLADPDMLAEDLCYDASRHRILVSSVRRGEIDIVEPDGQLRMLVPTGQPGVWGIFGLGVDARRQLLWATTIAVPGSAGYTRADSGHSALLAYDVRSGTLVKRLVPSDSGPHALGDLTISPGGVVYVADGAGGGIYAADPSATALRTVVAPGTFASPQTPALAGDGRRLFVPDYAFGIAVVDLARTEWHWLKHPDSLALTGIDGLYRSGRDLIAVQNGLAPNRITRLGVGPGDRVASQRVLIRGGDGVDLNHALVGQRALVFISQSGWDRIADDGGMTSGRAIDAPMLRRIRW